MEMLQGVWKQHLRPRAVVGYGVKIFLPSPPNYVTRSLGHNNDITNCGMMQRKKSYTFVENLNLLKSPQRAKRASITMTLMVKKEGYVHR